MKTFRRKSGRGSRVGLHADRGRAPLPPTLCRCLRPGKKSSELYCGYWFFSEFFFSEAFNSLSAGQLVHDCLLVIRNEPAIRPSGYPPPADAPRCRCQLHSAATSTPRQTPKMKCALCGAPPPNHGLTAPRRGGRGSGPSLERRTPQTRITIRNVI